MDGVAIGTGAAYVAGGSEKSMVGFGILGGLTSVIADSMVKDVYFSVITDLQIRERMRGGERVTQTSSQFAKSGSGGGLYVSHSAKSDWKIEQTRILSSANKVNLEFTQAEPELRKGIAKSIAGIF